jgi:hypothetical protein
VPSTPGAIFAFVTAPFFSCFVPTVFLGNILVAAYAVPPARASSSAKDATTLA